MFILKMIGNLLLGWLAFFPSFFCMAAIFCCLTGAGNPGVNSYGPNLAQAAKWTVSIGIDLPIYMYLWFVEPFFVTMVDFFKAL